MTAGTAGATASSPQRRGRIVATGRTAALMTARGHQPLGMGRMTAGAGRGFISPGKLFKLRATISAAIFVKWHGVTPSEKNKPVSIAARGSPAQ